MIVGTTKRDSLRMSLKVTKRKAKVILSDNALRQQTKGANEIPEKS